jgi:NADH oxidase (H2O2-forming)
METVAERVDTMSIVISKQVKCDELVSMEFAYAPPVSMVVDPVVLAAEDACEKLKNFKN